MSILPNLGATKRDFRVDFDFEQQKKILTEIYYHRLNISKQLECHQGPYMAHHLIPSFRSSPSSAINHNKQSGNFQRRRHLMCLEDMYLHPLHPLTTLLTSPLTVSVSPK